MNYRALRGLDLDIFKLVTVSVAYPLWPHIFTGRLLRRQNWGHEVVEVSIQAKVLLGEKCKSFINLNDCLIIFDMSMFY